MEPGQNTEAYPPGSVEDIRELLARARTAAEGAHNLAMGHTTEPGVLAAVSAAWTDLAVAEMHAAMFAVPRMIIGGDIPLGDPVSRRPR